jgi:hypothetical protein
VAWFDGTRADRREPSEQGVEVGRHVRDGPVAMGQVTDSGGGTPSCLQIARTVPGLIS